MHDFRPEYLKNQRSEDKISAFQPHFASFIRKAVLGPASKQNLTLIEKLHTVLVDVMKGGRVYSARGDIHFFNSRVRWDKVNSE
jgi:hypothetical protein